MRNWLIGFITYLITSACMTAPLPAQDVFKLETQLVDPNTISVQWHIKEGYFLYSDRLHITTIDDAMIQLGDIRFPATTKKVDKLGHEYDVYRNDLVLSVPVLSKHPGEALVDIRYQGCSDEGFCYPPQWQQIKLTINDQLGLSQVEAFTSPEQAALPQEQSETDRVESLFSSKHWSVILLSFFSFGLLLAFTPCVLPMVPVLSGIIVGHGDQLSTRKSFFLSLSYVLSMAFTYAVVGAVVALIGSNLQLMMQSSWVIGLFSGLFILLALSMFGFFELKLPVSWQMKLAKLNRRQASGHYISAAIMGCLSTLILSPCVTAPLIGALSYIAHTGNVLFGSISLFFLGLGMGTPLLLIGLSAGRWLPKAGAWMNGVKTLLGVLLLGVAISLLDRILPSLPIMILWACLCVFSGIYIGALTRSTTNYAKFQQGLGIILLVYGLLILIGASMGGNNPLQPLSGNIGLSRSHSQAKLFSADKIEQAIVDAKGKPVMLDFYADWCTSCKIMENTTFRNPKVMSALNQFVLIKVDVTDNTSANKALMQKFNVIAPPTFVFFGAQGNELSSARIVGEVDSQDLLKHLEKIIDEKGFGASRSS